MPSTTRTLPALYEHEMFFGAFLLVTFVRLLSVQGMFWGDTLMFGAGLLAALMLVAYDRHRNTDASLRWRLLFYPVAMNVYFQQMRSAVPAISSSKEDTILRGIDSALLGDTPSMLWQHLVTPGLTELMSLCYLFFFPYLIMGVVVNFLGPMWRCKSFIAGLFSLYGVGFLGYTLVPAAGPYLAFGDAFATQLTGGPLTVFNASLVKMGSTGVDVFPSLHVAVSLFILGFDFRHNRRRFWICLLPCLGLWCSTLYLRYHYLIDVLCGALLAAWALWIANRYTPTTENPA
ncbi:MAG: phosphatase PAP2 family protein [Nitrosomonadales bacterium]|nr:phosphatase PAP2 family protein [Nitrosomonadales bacterium]